MEKLAQNAGLRLVSRDLFFDLQKGKMILRIRSAHELYLQHMIENFDSYIDSVMPLQVNGHLLVDMSGPRYHRLKGFADLPFLFPSHTEPYRTTAEYLDFAGLSEGKIVLDIGAYAAITSIIFGQLVGVSGHVYAFEADPINYECALQNLELAQRWMGINNVTLIHKAVWSHNQGVLFSQEGAMGSSAIAVTGSGRGVEVRVPSITLGEFFAEYELDHIDFIKVDVEGCEIELLKNSIKFLSRTKPKMIIEPHMICGTLSTQRCRELMEQAGYRVNVRKQVCESEPLIEAHPL